MAVTAPATARTQICVCLLKLAETDQQQHERISEDFPVHIHEVYINVCVCKYMYIYTYIYTHTHTQSSKLIKADLQQARGHLYTFLCKQTRALRVLTFHKQRKDTLCVRHCAAHVQEILAFWVHVYVALLQQDALHTYKIHAKLSSIPRTWDVRFANTYTPSCRQFLVHGTWGLQTHTRQAVVNSSYIHIHITEAKYLLGPPLCANMRAPVRMPIFTSLRIIWRHHIQVGHEISASYQGGHATEAPLVSQQKKIKVFWRRCK